MASDVPSPSDPIAGDSRTCPLCLERLRQPRILPCRHTYCRGCLEGLRGGGRGPRCPECRADVPPPADVEPGPLCPLAARCLDCGSRLPPAGEPRCPCHPCAGPVCRQCRRGPHREAPEEAARVARLLAGVEEAAGRASRGRAALERELEGIRRHEAGLRDVVTQAGAEAARRLLAQQEETLAALRRHVEGREEAAARLRAALERQEWLARGVAEVAREALARGRPLEVAALESLLARQLARLRDFRWEPLGGPRPRLAVRAELRTQGGLFQLDFGEAGADGRGGDSVRQDGPARELPAPSPEPPVSIWDSPSLSPEPPVSIWDSPSLSPEPPVSIWDSPSLSPEPPVSIWELPAPSLETPVSLRDSPALSPKTPVSLRDSPAPSLKKPVHLRDSPAPSPETPVSIRDSPAPSPKTPVSLRDSPAPSPKTPVSLRDSPAPSLKTPILIWDSPATSPETPVSLRESPAPSPETPVSLWDSPAPSPKTPVSLRDSPAPSPETPVSVWDSPSPSLKMPVHLRDSPAPSPETPVFIRDSPAPSPETPVSLRDSPAPSLETPVSVWDSPSPSLKMPVHLRDSPAPSPEPPASALAPPPRRPPPTAHFSCSFSVRVPGDKHRPRITGICPLGPRELLLADEENRGLKRFSLQGDFRGAVPVHAGAAPCSVAAVGSRVAYTAGNRLYLAERDGGLVWQKALRPTQASHALAPAAEGGVAVSVAGHLEVYDARGELVEKIFPDGHSRRAMVFVAGRPGGYVATDWHRRSVVAFDSHGQVLAELGEEQLERCQPGAVCADARGYFYVVLRELNRVVAFGPGGEALGPVLTARHGVERARVATVTGPGHLALALSNGTVHVFRMHYPGQGAGGS